MEAVSDVLLIDTDVLIDAGRGISEAVIVLQQAAERGALVHGGRSLNEVSSA